MACCSFIAALMIAIASWKEIVVRDDRALLHVFLPPWKPSDPVSHSQPDGLPGLKWRPGPQLLAYGLDPATSSTCMLEGMDLVRMNLSEGGVPTPALRMNFSSASPGVSPHLYAPTAALDDVLGFQAKGYHSTEPHFPKQVQLIVPARAAEPGKNETALGAYLHTAVSGGNRRFFPRPGHKRKIGALSYPEGIASLNDRASNYFDPHFREPSTSVWSARPSPRSPSTKPSPGHISGIAFFKGDAYIVDSQNQRILKFSPGSSEAEVFFGGKGFGSDLDQLHNPRGPLGEAPPMPSPGHISGIAFFKGDAYIADRYNYRILKFSPGSSEAVVFFGGKGFGSDLDQLSFPTGIAFFEETAYIGDSGNDRILKVSPGNSEAEIFFGGKGSGSDLDQLNNPRGLAFSDGNAYIVDSWNNRVIQVPRPRLQSLAQQADTLDLGQQLRSCTRLREHEHAGVKILQAEDSENCFVSMPREIESTAEQLALITVDNAGSKAISAQIQEKKLKLKHAQISHLPLGVSVPMRKVHFGTLLLTIAVSSMAAHASGSPRAHWLFLVFAVAFASVCYSHGWLLPLAKAGDLWPALIIPGLALPWSVVPVYLISNFAEFTQNSFGPDFQVTSCSDGVAWEFHLLTAVLAATTCSIWALALSKQLQKVAETPLLLVPKFLKSYLSDGLRAWDAEPHPPLRRLEIALAWIHKGIADLYLDFISFLVMRTCGYQYAWYGFFLAILTVLLQNVGGAMYISFTVKGPQKLGYAFLCLVLTPPWKLLDPMALERVGIFLTSVRVILEDLPQLLLKVHFTLTVYRNPFVIFDILLTIPFALFDMKEVCSYCSRKEGKVETYAPVTVDDQRDRERGLVLVADPAFARSPDNLEDTDAAGTPRTPSNFLSCCVDFLRKSQTRAIQP
ncbi:pknD [Symbiodinium sp. CCMP2456]|nr:pknD [Symbiodinium sp. CCMP2456]